MDHIGIDVHKKESQICILSVPREWSSGEGQHRGRITKAGHRRVRRLLV